MIRVAVCWHKLSLLGEHRLFFFISSQNPHSAHSQLIFICIFLSIAWACRTSILTVYDLSLFKLIIKLISLSTSRSLCRRRGPARRHSWGWVHIRLHPHPYSAEEWAKNVDHFAGLAQTQVVVWSLFYHDSSLWQNMIPKSFWRPLKRYVSSSSYPRSYFTPDQEFACNGTLVDDEKMGQVIQLQGDQRAKISNFLSENGIEKSTIKVHGFWASPLDVRQQPTALPNEPFFLPSTFSHFFTFTYVTPLFLALWFVRLSSLWIRYYMYSQLWCT